MKKISVFLSVMLFFTCLYAVEIDSSYKIAVSDKQEVQDVYAAQELAKYLSEVIGSNFAVVKESEISAGNNFRISQPKFIAFVISVGVKTPGTHKIFFFLQNLITSSFNPGITIKSAPELIASFAIFTETTEPAPTSIFENSFFTVFIYSGAFPVLKVISIMGKSFFIKLSEIAKAKSPKVYLP